MPLNKILNYGIQWNRDFSYLQGIQKLGWKIGWLEKSGKITAFDWGGETTFGLSYQEARKTEGLRIWDSTVIRMKITVYIDGMIKCRWILFRLIWIILQLVWNVCFTAGIGGCYFQVYAI